MDVLRQFVKAAGAGTGIDGMGDWELHVGEGWGSVQAAPLGMWDQACVNGAGHRYYAPAWPSFSVTSTVGRNAAFGA